jgi:hypothetical protein
MNPRHPPRNQNGARSVDPIPCPETGGVLGARVADDFALDGGTWELTESESRQPIARITPPATPMFRQIVEYLETKPVPAEGNFRRDGEARAAVAVCLRWGYELSARRVLPKAEQAIIRQAQRGVYTGLKAVDILKYATGWPPSAEQVLPFLHPLIGPSRWSCTEESRAVELPLRRGGRFTAGNE